MSLETLEKVTKTSFLAPVCKDCLVSLGKDTDSEESEPGE